MNSVSLNNLSLEYHRFTPSGCEDTGIRIFEFAAISQFLRHVCACVRMYGVSVHVSECLACLCMCQDVWRVCACVRMYSMLTGRCMQENKISAFITVGNATKKF